MQRPRTSSDRNTRYDHDRNKLDFAIVVGSIVDMATYYTIGSDPRNDEEGNEGSFTVVVLLTSLRTLRALRPMRMLRRAKTLRRLGKTIVKSLAALSSGMVLYLAFIYVGGVLLLQFLAGRMSRCSDPSAHFKRDCTGLDDLNEVRRWQPSIFNSDWIGPALLSALAVASGSQWGSSMVRGLNAAQQQEAGPVFRASSEMLALYLLLVLVGKFIFANLFLAVLAQAYSEVNRERRHASALRRARLRRLRTLAHLNHEYAAASLSEIDPGDAEKPLAEKLEANLRSSRAARNQNKAQSSLPPRVQRRQKRSDFKVSTAARKLRELAAKGREGLEEAAADEEQTARKLTRKDLPLLYVEPTSALRRAVFRALSTKSVEAIVFVSILLNLSLSSLTALKASHVQQTVARHGEFVFAGIFSFELAMRCQCSCP